MTRDVGIETARAADAPIVLDLLLRQFEEHGIAAGGAPLGEAVAAVLADERLGFFEIARDRHGVVGIAYVSFTWALEHCGKSAWLEELYVVPAGRGRGVGRALLEAALARAAACGAAAADLEVDRDHARAENLYRRAGFHPLPRARWVRRLGS